MILLSRKTFWLLGEEEMIKAGTLTRRTLDFSSYDSSLYKDNILADKTKLMCT